MFFSERTVHTMASTWLACIAAVVITDLLYRASSILPSFPPCTTTEVRRIIMSLPVKSCSLDAALTFLVREFVDVLLPYLTAMFNASLTQGRLPVSQRHAIMTPLLKKTGLKSTVRTVTRAANGVVSRSELCAHSAAHRLQVEQPRSGLTADDACWAYVNKLSLIHISEPTRPY